MDLGIIGLVARYVHVLFLRYWTFAMVYAGKRLHLDYQMYFFGTEVGPESVFSILDSELYSEGFPGVG